MNNVQKLLQDEDSIALMLPIKVTDYITIDIYNGYKAILSDTEEYPYIYQMWCFLPDIDENYQKFNLGRYTAFSELGITEYPVSTCVSADRNHIVLHAILGKHKPHIIDNPVQVLPQNYPKQYGNIPPAFSRAAIVNNKLRISGTASIIGSTTIHENDIITQTKETMLNIERLIEQANKYLDKELTPKSLVYTVYLKNISDEYEVRRLLYLLYGELDINMHIADMCRKDLLIEIEAYQE